MADVSGKFFSAKKVRTGVSPSSPGVEQGETLPPVNPPGSDLNSVGLSMPSAFNVANTPLNSNGTIAVTGAGTTAQYVRGDGSLADFPQTSGGGSSVSYYLNGSVNQGTIGGVAYKELSKVPILGAGTDFTINADGYIASFITDAGDPNLLEIPGGNWNFETYFSASSGGGSPTFYVELYKYNGTTFTLIASSVSAPELIAFGTNLTPYFSTLAVPTTTLALTDRLAIRYYVTHSGRTITMHTENNTLCQIITTFTTGVTALNGLTAQVQNFAVGTTGTDFNIASAVATHTFNLPTASATNRGALNSADWTTFNNKQNALNGTGFVKISGTTISYDNSTYQLLSAKGQPNGYAGLDSNGKVPLAQINDALIGNVNFQGLWNAATNSPTLANPPASGTKGYYYIVSTAGTFAGISFEVGDWIISDGSAWGKVDNTDAVSSVFGRTGNVTAANGDYNTSQVTENTNLYYTEARVSANTDVAANTAARHNAVTLGTANGLSLNVQQLSLQLATSGQNGALSSTDWTTFNNKENAITAGTTAQYYRGDKTFQTLNTAAVPESGNLYFTNARAIGSVLTGYASGAGTISAADTILSAIQKLNGNIGALVTGVSSVNGLTGAVTLTTTNIAEGTNLYYTEARVNANANVAANTAARHAAVTLGTPNGLSLSTQQLSLGLASAGVTGALSGTDWSTFNSKQQALNGTGFVKISGTTISYDNSTYLTTAAAASTYLPLAGGTMTGNINWAQTDRGLTWGFNTDGASIKFYNTGDGDTDSRLEFATLDNNNEYFRWGHIPSGGSFYESMRLVPNGSGSAQLIVTGSIIKSGGTSSQFLKADGSVDSNTYYLASNPSAFIALTALSGTAPIQYNNTTGAISITQASGSTNGFLSSTDWNTFNSKQQALNGTGFVKISGTTISYDNSTYYLASNPSGFISANQTITLSGDATGSGATSIIVTLANSGVTAGTYNNVATQVRPFTVDAKGRITSIGTAVTITPAFSDVTGKPTTLAGYGITDAVPSNRTITINGTAQDLSANRTFNVGTVTSVAALTLGTSGTDLSSSVANGTTTPVITLNVPTASASNRGVLSAADWTTFNNKQNALTNPVTGTGTTNYLPKFTGASTIGNSQVFDNGTNVGIGTASPSVAAGLGLVLNGQAGQTRLAFKNNYTGDSSGDGVQFALIGGSSAFVFQNRESDGYFSFETNGNEVYRTSGTNLLVGTTTDNGARLQVSGAGTIGSGTQGINTDADLTLREGVAFVGLDFKSARTSGNVGGLRFYNTSSDSVPIAQQLIETDGKFVFYNGASGAEARLTIASTGAATFTGNNVGHLMFVRNTNNGQYSSTDYLDDAGAEKLIVGYANSGNGTFGSKAIFYGTSGVGLSFYTNGVNTERLRIETTGAATFSSSVTANGDITSTALEGKVRITSTAGSGKTYQFISIDTGNLGLFDGTAYRLWVAGSGNIGIGTASPNYLLHIAAGAANPQLQFTSTGTGSTTSDGFHIGVNNSTLNAFLLQKENASLQFLTNDTERMRLDASGNLGLGVTPSAWNSAYKAFQFGTTGALFGESGDAANYFTTNTFVDSVGFKYITSDWALGYFQENGVHSWRTAPSGTAGNAISFTQAMTLGSNSGLSIGTPSAAPAQGLLVQGAATFSNQVGFGTGLYIDTNGDLYQPVTGRVFISAAAANVTFPSYGFYNDTGLGMYRESTDTLAFATSGVKALTLASNQAATFSSSVTAGGNIITTGGSFFTINNGRYGWGSGSIYIDGDSNNDFIRFITANTERMRITSGGNVLIGTTTSVNHPLVVRSNTDANSICLVGRSSDNASSLDFFGSNSSTFLMEMRVDTLSADLNYQLDAPMIFYTNTVPRMRITNNGNLLINTTDNTGGERLRVGGTTFTDAIVTMRPSSTTVKSDVWKLGRAALATSSVPEDIWVRVQIGTKNYDLLAIDRGTA